MLENLRDWILGLWDDWTTFVRDLLVWLVDGVLGGIATAIESVPSPDFLAGGADGYLSGLGEIYYFLAMSGFDVGLGLIGAATGFRLVRIFATLGIWS